MSQSDINKVRRSVGMNIGSKVKIRANRGRHKIDNHQQNVSKYLSGRDRE